MTASASEQHLLGDQAQAFLNQWALLRLCYKSPESLRSFLRDPKHDLTTPDSLHSLESLLEVAHSGEEQETLVDSTQSQRLAAEESSCLCQSPPVDLFQGYRLCVHDPRDDFTSRYSLRSFGSRPEALHELAASWEERMEQPMEGEAGEQWALSQKALQMKSLRLKMELQLILQMEVQLILQMEVQLILQMEVQLILQMELQLILQKSPASQKA